MEISHVTHKSIPPFINEKSEILILGSLPSIASREQGFFYAHPQNRFFKVLAKVFDEEEPKGIDERKAFLLRNNIALYDVIYECDICGSSDASIKNVVPIDIKSILKKYPNIQKIFLTGKKSKELFDKYLQPICPIPGIGLPSTSAANANMSLETLVEQYKIIRK